MFRSPLPTCTMAVSRPSKKWSSIIVPAPNAARPSTRTSPNILTAACRCRPRGIQVFARIVHGPRSLLVGEGAPRSGARRRAACRWTCPCSHTWHACCGSSGTGTGGCAWSRDGGRAPRPGVRFPGARAVGCRRRRYRGAAGGERCADRGGRAAGRLRHRRGAARAVHPAARCLAPCVPPDLSRCLSCPDGAGAARPAPGWPGGGRPAPGRAAGRPAGVAPRTPDRRPAR